MILTDLLLIYGKMSTNLQSKERTENMVKIIVLLAVLLNTIIIIRVISVLKKKDINNTPDKQIFYSENEFETFD